MKVFRIHETQDYITDAAVASSACSLIPAGSALMVVRSGILQHTIPIAINDVPVCLNQDMKALLPEEGLISEYLAYLVQGLNERFLDEWVKQGATVESVEHQAMVDTPIPVPPRNLQLAIAAYLGTETTRIDALIDEKRELIAALDEMKQAVITEVIAAGVRPDASHVPGDPTWFPSVPTTWRVVRLKFLLAGIEQGWSPQAETRQAEEGEWGVLKAGACNGGEFNADEQKALPADVVPDISLEVREGDVLMSRGSGSVDLVGSVALVGPVRPRLMLSDLLYRLTIHDSTEVNAQWLVLALGSGPLRRQIRLSLRGAEGLTRKVAIPDIKELVLPVPPRTEQDAMVEHLRVEGARFDKLIGHATKEIDLLRELRAATIADAVLGRIDVREHMKN